MASLESLVEDHKLLRAMLDALEQFTSQTLGDPAAVRRDLPGFTSFFRIFGDVHHATKEEVVLLPFLVRHGASWESSPLSQTRDEHRRERYFMRTLEQLAAQEADYDAEAMRHLLSELGDFVTSMRAHLDFETAQVFPLVEQLAPEQKTQLDDQLEAFDASPPSSHDLPQMRQLAKQLTARYARPLSS